ncbi:universal stress protein [Streptomyces tibetensis]|uniref:universal stress protein n=1 Tax=Streptomyces tibetensis TaxID=2382123 RepID=UPI003F53E896
MSSDGRRPRRRVPCRRGAPVRTRGRGAGRSRGHLVAASRDADLVVVGPTGGACSHPSGMMGSVSHAVLLHAVSPVAVVPPSPSED